MIETLSIIVSYDQNRSVESNHCLKLMILIIMIFNTVPSTTVTAAVPDRLFSYSITKQFFALRDYTYFFIITYWRDH